MIRKDHAAFSLPSPVSDTSSPPSPCIKVCLLDEAQVCTGCGRSLDEIAEWGGAAEARKREILERAAKRRQARPPTENRP